MAPVQAAETFAGEVIGVPPPPSGTIVVEAAPAPMAAAGLLPPATMLTPVAGAARGAPSIAPVAAMPAKKGMGIGTRLAIGVAVTILAFVVAIVVLSRIVNIPTNTTTYADDFNNDYTAMLTADNAAIDQQNSNTLATSVAGLKARIAARKTFDSQIGGISFPVSANADVQQVLATDAAVEQILAKSVTDRGNVPAYKADIAAEKPLRAAFDAAVKKLLAD